MYISIYYKWIKHATQNSGQDICCYDTMNCITTGWGCLKLKWVEVAIADLCKIHKCGSGSDKHTGMYIHLQQTLTYNDHFIQYDHSNI